MEVLPLASRHFSLQMSELADVTDLLVAYEKQNQMRVTWSFLLKWEGKVPYIEITAKAWGMKGTDPEAKPLASVSVKCSDMNLRHWNAALTHVLYALDFQCALLEFDNAERKRA
jgi:hypothetical protein